MKVDAHINHEGKKVAEIFDLTKERSKQISQFLSELTITTSTTEMKKSEVIEKVIEFANSTVEAVMIFGLFQENKKLANRLLNTILGALTGDKPGRKAGCIEIRDGEIHSMTGDEMPDEMIDELEGLVNELKKTKPTGNMTVDGDGKLN